MSNVNMSNQACAIISKHGFVIDNTGLDSIKGEDGTLGFIYFRTHEDIPVHLLAYAGAHHKFWNEHVQYRDKNAKHEQIQDSMKKANKELDELYRVQLNESAKKIGLI